MNSMENFVRDIYTAPEKAYDAVKKSFYGMTNQELKNAFVSLAFAVYDMTDASTNEKIVKSWAVSLADDYEVELNIPEYQ